MKKVNLFPISNDTTSRKYKKRKRKFEELSTSLQIYLMSDDLHFDDIQSLEFYGYPTERKIDVAQEIYRKYNFIRLCLFNNIWGYAKRNNMTDRFLKKYAGIWHTNAEEFYNSKLYAYLERGKVDWDKMYKPSGGIVKKERW